ncbi:hypothetical protein [Caldivirga sp.]
MFSNLSLVLLSGSKLAEVIILGIRKPKVNPAMAESGHMINGVDNQNNG